MTQIHISMAVILKIVQMYPVWEANSAGKYKVFIPEKYLALA
jgi:hypothetical protein